jgi:hypothetical protein
MTTTIRPLRTIKFIGLSETNTIGYYHVSDTSIALFSHFIPCGVWEAVYI